MIPRWAIILALAMIAFAIIFGVIPALHHLNGHSDPNACHHAVVMCER